MKLRFTPVIAIVLTIFMFVQCKKKNPEEPAEETPTTAVVTVNNLNDLFAQDGVQVESAVASTTTQQTISIGGVKINIPSNAFVTSTNGTVTGNVDISIKGIFTKSDIILSGAPGNSAGKLISTKGCVKVSASQNSQTLRIAPTASVYVNVPETTMSPDYTLRKFIANKVSPSDTALYWRADPDSTNIPVVFDTMAAKYYYKARIDSVNWLNVGSKWDTIATKTNVVINVNSMFNKTNCAVYISFNGALIVGALYELSPNTYMITNIPVGRAVTILAIGVINGQYYSDFLPTTITASFNQNLNLTSTTKGQIQTQLNALP